MYCGPCTRLLENPELLAKLGLDKKKKPAKPENTNSVSGDTDGPDATGGADSAAGDTGKIGERLGRVNRHRYA